MHFSAPIRSWRVTELGGFDLLHGTFKTQAFRPHTHETYSIGLLEHGHMAFACRGATHGLRPGMVGLINPDEVHTGHAPNMDGWTYRNFYPEVSLLHSVLKELRRSRTELPRLPNVIDDPLLARVLIEAHRAFDRSASSLERESLMRQGLAALLLRHALPNADLPIQSAPFGIQRVRAVLEEEYARNVTLQELASLADLNAFTLLRSFRRAYGLPPHAYQLQVRLRHAKRLLRQGEAPAQSALLTGFADQSHLGRHFRRAFGITPHVYRSGASKTF